MIRYLLPFLYSLFLSAVFISLYKIRFDLKKLPKIPRYSFAAAMFLLVMALFLYVFPSFYLKLTYSYLPHSDYFFLRSDIWAFVLMGLFPGLFALIPMTRWFEDSGSWGNIRNKIVIYMALIIVFIPNLIVSIPYVSFEEKEIRQLGYFSIFEETFSYDEFQEIEIEPHEYISNNSRGSRTKTYAIQFYLVKKDQTKMKVLETEYNNEELAKKAAGLCKFLQKKNIIYNDHFFLYLKDWKDLFDKYYF